MIHFLIPLRCKESSNNWETVVKNFQRTLNSCFNQTCDEYKVVVVCHKSSLPYIDNSLDKSKLAIVPLDKAAPTTSEQMMKDKHEKIFAGMTYIGDSLAVGDSTYVMPLDADDLVSNRIAQFFKGRNDHYCYVSKFGYIWFEGSKWLRKARDMWRTCGSCTIINYNKSELPTSANPCNDGDYIFANSHREIPVIASKMGKEFRTLPFASTIYVLGTGENHSTNYGIKLSWKRYVEAIINFPRYFSARKKNEFIKK